MQHVICIFYGDKIGAVRGRDVVEDLHTVESTKSPWHGIIEEKQEAKKLDEQNIIKLEGHEL